MPVPGPRTNTGNNLNKEWKVGAQHALYHQHGKWFMPLRRFPGAYFDPNGYVLFDTKTEYENSPYVDIGERVNIRQGIYSMPGYVRERP